jgi:hypothetical protein
MKFTFKKHRPTGRYASFETEHHDIKLKRKTCGYIKERSHFAKIKEGEEDLPYHVALMVYKTDEDKASAKNNTNVDWKWIYLKQKFANADKAKEAINGDLLERMLKFKLRFSDEL